MAAPGDSSQRSEDSASPSEQLAAVTEDASGPSGSWSFMGRLKEVSAAGAASRGDGQYRFGDFTRGAFQKLRDGMPENAEKFKQFKSEVTETARENFVQSFRQAATDIKESINESGSQLVKSMVEGSLQGDEEALNQAQKSAEAKTAETIWNRLWNDARVAVHKPHDLSKDAPLPPERALSLKTALDDEYRLARGLLQVELLAISPNAEGRLLRNDGSYVVSPLCQLMFGRQLTGALRPAADDEDPAARDRVPSSPSASGSTSSASMRAKTTSESRARFPVEEIVGSDLHVHIFDAGSTKFDMGLEESAFCGGAIVSLAAALRKSPGARRICGESFSARELQAEVAVKLLSFDALKERFKFDGLLDDDQPPDLGHVLLKLTLTLYDHSPMTLYGAVPFRSQFSPSIKETGRVSDPASVVKAAFLGLQRVKSALDMSSWIEAGNQLREHLPSIVFLQALWMYSLLMAPRWQWPGLVAVPLFLLMRTNAAVVHDRRAADPPRLYKAPDAEASSEPTSLSITERGKQSIKQAVKMQLGLMNFATSCTDFARRVERITYVLTFRDPQLTVIVGLGGGGATLAVTVFLWFWMLIFGHKGWAVLIWVAGTIGLLPKAAQATLQDIMQKLKAEKTRLLGPDVLAEKAQATLSALWERIPDGMESLHVELCENSVCIS
eukprot:TRINITY_DN59316_c0_g1_i1.p1 TRINITY_DN59316_c0_g1~~TRINITY_DN59316_c0_g1_i1.p1  ORF type:complete len:670 (+),score=184.57 TRINITY_DN59316_c0_g1_i1:52-2061(+)